MINIGKWKSGIEKWKNLFCNNFFYLNSKWYDIKSEWFDMFLLEKNEVNSVVEYGEMYCNGV